MSELNVILGENGTGKTNLLEAIAYFYDNLTSSMIRQDVFDKNNRFSNEVRISVSFDMGSFVKIFKSKYERALLDENANASHKNYYRAIVSLANKSSRKIVSAELTQIKGKGISWNCTYEARQILKSLFPLFHIDTRNLDINEWSYIWEALGELAKVSNTERQSIEEKIHNAVVNDSKEISKKLTEIEEIFESSSITVKRFQSKEFARDLSKIYFSGEVLQKHGNSLNYYSAGTNSVQYIELLLKTIDEISRMKIKEPIVLFDEPEISLHPNLIDELADAIVDVNSKMCILLSTHSSRLVKNTIVKSEAATVYKVKLEGGYSRIGKINKFPEYAPESKYRVTDEHINSYFSRAILFVEGETELELFSNPYLLLLFPKLKQIDVFKGMTQAKELCVMNPKLVNMKTPYICLIDMDKAIRYDKKTNRFNLKSEYFKKDGKEKLLYYNKHTNQQPIVNLRKRIDAMGTKLRVHYYLPFYSCNDSDFFEFVDAVHQYLLAHNIFTIKTTIEGALINQNSVDRAIDFLKKKKPKAHFEQFSKYANNLMKTDKVNFVRLIFNGKSDLLIKKDNLNFGSVETDIYNKMHIGSKTDGWVSEFIDEFFEPYVTCEGPMAPKTFQRVLLDTEKRKRIRKDFQYSFPELYSLINVLCGMIN